MISGYKRASSCGIEPFAAAIGKELCDGSQGNRPPGRGYCRDLFLERTTHFAL
jgi:hypothetical protein